MKDGVSIEQAQAQLTPIAERLEQQYPTTNGGRRVEVARLQDFMTANAKPYATFAGAFQVSISSTVV